MLNESIAGLKKFKRIDEEECFKLSEVGLQVRPMRLKNLEFKYDDPSNNFVCSYTQFIITNGEKSLEQAFPLDCQHGIKPAIKCQKCRSSGKTYDCSLLENLCRIMKH